MWIICCFLFKLWFSNPIRTESAGVVVRRDVVQWEM